MQTHTLHGSVGRCTALCNRDKSRQQRRSAAKAADAHRWSARRGKPGLLACNCLHLDGSISHALAEENKTQSTLLASWTLGAGACPPSCSRACVHQFCCSAIATTVSTINLQVLHQLVGYDQPSHSLQSGRALLSAATSLPCE